MDYLEEIISNMVELGYEMNILVVVMGDVYYLNFEDKIYCKILIYLQFGNLLNWIEWLDVYFCLMDEMFKDFDFLGMEMVYEVVVDMFCVFVD